MTKISEIEPATDESDEAPRARRRRKLRKKPAPAPDGPLALAWKLRKAGNAMRIG
jgi:hypothetical protein